MDALLALTRPKSPLCRARRRKHLGDPEGPLDAVVLGDRDVFTNGEAVTIEPEDRFLLVARVVVAERPVVATVMNEAAVSVFLRRSRNRCRVHAARCAPSPGHRDARRP